MASGLPEKLDGAVVIGGGDSRRSSGEQRKPRGQRGDVRLPDRGDVSVGFGVAAGMHCSLDEIEQHVLTPCRCEAIVPAGLIFDARW